MVVVVLKERWYSMILKRPSTAKATTESCTDVEVRRRGEQTGLGTLVVHADNDEC